MATGGLTRGTFAGIVGLLVRMAMIGVSSLWPVVESEKRRYEPVPIPPRLDYWFRMAPQGILSVVVRRESCLRVLALKAIIPPISTNRVELP